MSRGHTASESVGIALDHFDQVVLLPVCRKRKKTVGLFAREDRDEHPLGRSEALRDLGAIRPLRDHRAAFTVWQIKELALLRERLALHDRSHPGWQRSQLRLIFG